MKSEFPHDVNQTPPEARLTEVFGLTPLFCALGLLGFSVTLGETLFPLSMRDVKDGLLVLATGLAGLGCLGYEVRRRMNRTRLLVQGERIAVYRGAFLSEEIQRAQVVEYKLDHGNTFKMVAGPLVIGGTLVFLALKPGGDPKLKGWLAGMGGVLLGLAATTLATRLACRHFFIPKGAKHETVVLSKPGARRLLGLE